MQGSKARVNTLTRDMATGFKVSSQQMNLVLNRSSCFQHKHEEMVNKAQLYVNRVLFTLVSSQAPGNLTERKNAFLIDIQHALSYTYSYGMRNSFDD